MSVLMPKTKLPVEQAETKDLEWWANKIEGDLATNPTKAYAEQDRIKAEAMRAELARRKAGGKPAAKPAAPKPSTALAAAGGTQLAKNAIEGGYVTASLADAKLREANENFHLVTPATSCGSLPLGCEVSISVVHVNANSDDVANVGGGKFSLSGNVLKRIGAAAGIDWDPNLSRRLDNGRNPHYCHFRAVGYVRLFDGAVRTVTGEVEIDMRDGSPQVVAMQQRAKKDSNFESQLRDTRFFLIRHAESKAKNRAIADIGVKRSYTAAELAKPFAVARLMFTGRGIENPRIAEMVAGKITDHMLGGARALYGSGGSAGSQSDPPPRLPSGQEMPLPSPQLAPAQGHDAPPIGAVAGQDSDYEADGEAVRTPLPGTNQRPENDDRDDEDELAAEAKASGAY